MKNLLLVARFEIQSVLTQRSFWVSTFLLPILILGFTFSSQVLYSSDQSEIQNEDVSRVVFTNTGVVDPAGILRLDQDGEKYKLYSTEIFARTAIEKGEINAYFLISPDSLQTGIVELHVRNYSPLTQMELAAVIELLLEESLVSDRVLSSLLSAPLKNAEIQAISEPINTDSNFQPGENTFIAYFVLFIFFMMISISSGMAMRSVSREKENRTAEILLVSIKPLDLMTGKLLGLSVITILQVLLWFSVLLTGTRQPLPFLPLSGSFTFPPGFVAWSLPFLLAGFLMYAAALTVLGVLAPSAREGTQFTFLVYLPLMLPLMLNSLFTTAPESDIVVFLSLFPLTAPLSMVTRLTLIPVPAWQLAASLAGVLFTTAGLLFTASRLFRPDTLLSFSTLDFQRLRNEISSAFRRNSS